MDSPNINFLSRFREAVSHYPEQLAVLQSGNSYSYTELDRLSDTLAAHLVQQGLAAGDIVACHLQRSPDLVIAILATLKAGAAYFPLDTHYPEARLAYMLDNAAPHMILHDDFARVEAYNSSATAIDIPSLLPKLVDSAATLDAVTVQDIDLAYVIYTSGSTGEPKGIKLSHGALANQLQWLQQRFEFGPCDRFLQKTPISFDASVWELLAPLCCGATLVLADPRAHHDPELLCTEVIANEITVLQVVPSVLQLMMDLDFAACHSLKRVFCGGEPLSKAVVDKFFSCSHAELHNLYGPSETAINATHWQSESGADEIYIGKPVAGVRAYILDKQQQLVRDGDEGELYLAGNQLAMAYIDNPVETDKCFVTVASIDEPRLYATGDIVKRHPNGLLSYLRREDEQLKIRGVRVEAGEIESAIDAYPGIRKSVVKLEQHTTRGDELVAYIQPEKAQWNDVSGLRDDLQTLLPTAFIPQHIQTIEKFPLTPSGKIDRKALAREASVERPSLNTEFRKPGTVAEKKMAQLWSDILDINAIGLDDSFFELGGSSLLAHQMVVAVNRQMDYALTVLDVFESPTIAGLITCQSGESVEEKQTVRAALPASEEIAVIGMAGRFPGARHIDQFWQNLCDGVESTTFFSDTELDPSIPKELSSDPAYVKACGIIPEAKNFDASFFGISPREAAAIDPQQRIFLETCWEALEDAGVVVEDTNSIGVFGGTGNNTYYLSNILPAAGTNAGMSEMARIAANEKDYTATRAAFKLGLKGPAIAVQTACSTSLVAVAMACQSLRSGNASMALAGGVSVHTPINSGHLYQEGSMLSPDGLTRSFDKDGKGTAFNSGAGIVVLKLLSQAKSDKDRIYAVIKGEGLNNDGADKASFTAPSIRGQQLAVGQALANANVDPRTISYVEAHGTATPLGDPIEVEALKRAFYAGSESRDKAYCAIGSVKSNVGHTVAAAGVAGLIKTCLSVYHRKLPPSLNYSTPNPDIDFSAMPFYVNTELQDWQGTVLRAGVSSFGVGGTNAHVIVESYQAGALDSDTKAAVESGPQLLLLSAKAKAPLATVAENLARYIEGKKSLDLAAVAYHLQTRRTHFAERRYLVVDGDNQVVSQIEKPAADASRAATFKDSSADIAFMFPGQGTQYPGMGAGLYHHYPQYRDIVDDCLSRLDLALQKIIKPILLASAEDDLDALSERLTQTEYAQVAIFITEYALARLWTAWGVKPKALIGHSIGEFVAATLAGVFSLDDGLTLVSARGRLMQAQPGGSMLSVRIPADQLRPELTEACDIAAINGPHLCVVAGPDQDILVLQEKLEQRDIPGRLLQTSHAFHSPMMDEVLAPFREVVASISLSKPQLPIVSTVTGTWLLDREATDVDYWTHHLRQTVCFADGVQTLLKAGNYLFLEVGARNTTATLASQQMNKDNRCATVSSLSASPVLGDGMAEHKALLKAVGDLWLNGIDIDWSCLQGTDYPVISLPPYPFIREEHWLEVTDPPQQPALGLVDNSRDLVNEITSRKQALASVIPFDSGSSQVDRKQQLITIVRDLFADESGGDLADIEQDTSFLELGFDSLLLTQVATSLKRHFKVDIAFRRLMEDLFTFEALTDYLLEHADDSVLPSENPVSDNESQSATPLSADTTAITGGTLMSSTTSDNPVQELINAQLKIMEMQLQALKGGPVGAEMLQAAMSSSFNAGSAESVKVATKSEKNTSPVKKVSHSRGTRIAKEKVGLQLSKAQQNWLDKMMQRYQEKYASSKAYAQQHRRYLADPRTVSGFGPEWKEVVFPIVTNRSKGSKLWDIDGNELIDTANGFGPIFFGHSPDFVTEALKQQLDAGIETGPQSPLAGEVAELFCELTGNERCTFACTGSEAVLGAIRLARTVTGRDKVVMFEGGYHGISDEVISRPGRDYQGMPASPGIPRESTSNMIVLPWGDNSSLELIKALGDELAAVLVEPVQSRMPEFHDQTFIQDLRAVTAQHETALILDEVVTGFRMAAGGIRERFDVDADLATYGKVVGGGFPIGMIAGKAKFMDALDGGYWAFGDDSVPECGVTFYAGTFVRHPLGLAAAKVVMEKIKSEGPQLYQQLEAKTADMASAAKAFIAELKCDVTFEEFASLFYITVPSHNHWGHMLFMLMRLDGIHIQHNRANFLTTEHSQEDVNTIVKAFKNALAQMIVHGLIEGDMVAAKKFLEGKSAIPKGARLGKNARGEPAYFIEDPENTGQYIEIGKP